MKKQTLITLICFISFIGFSHSQSSPSFFFASRHCRDSVATNLKETIHQTISIPFADSTAKKWAGAWWAMELMLYKPAGYDKMIPAQLQQLPQLSDGFQRSFLEMLYTLYQKEFAKEVEAIWKQLASPKNKAMALEYLANAGIFPSISKADSFWQSPWFTAYHQRWNQTKRKKLLPENFLHKSFLLGQVVLCSFQSTNRDMPGYLMIRDKNGKWLTDTIGKPYRFPQLARSITNLPYYLTNGNTPQGLYKITGTGVSANNWIGPTINLQMELPFESGYKTFFGSDTAYNAFYTKLLGENLAKFDGLYESYTAGKLGRSEIIAHGTTIDPSFYSGKNYFPLTPSLGCLCSPEWWNDKGVLEKSIQQDWMNVYLSLTEKPVYLVVAEVDGL